MTGTTNRWWQHWLTSTKPSRKSPRRACRRRRLFLEQFEARLAPAGLVPLAEDDQASTLRGIPSSDGAVFIAVLANDTDPDGRLNIDSLAITSPPSRGAAELQKQFTSQDFDSSPVGNGSASAFAGFADAAGNAYLAVTGQADSVFDGNHAEQGDYTLFIRWGDFDEFDPAVFDLQFPASLNPGEVDTFVIAGGAPETSFYAWIDNTLGAGSPDTQLGTFLAGVVYRPTAGLIGTDSFTYTVGDDEGNPSNAATVTIEVRNRPPVGDPVLITAASETPLTIDVLALANVIDLDGSLDLDTLAVAQQPLYGTAVVAPGLAANPTITYTTPGGFGVDTFNFVIRDNDGAATELPVQVEILDVRDTATTTEGAPVVIDVLANDLLPDREVDPTSLQIVSGPARGSATIVPGEFGPVVRYATDANRALNLVVDDPRDIDDGDYRPGRLSLREAVQLANRDRYTESFTYSVLDTAGQVLAGPVTVSVVVSGGPTTITFAPALTRWRSSTLRLSQVGDTSEGNSALAIQAPITIVGPTGARQITLAGQGRSSDLRAFVVAAGAELNLQNLTLSDFASDGAGGAIHVQALGAASLTNSTFTRNFALGQGGALFSLGEATLANSTFSTNEAREGGAIYNIGNLTATASTFRNNSAEDGGGLFNVGELELVSCNLSSNRAATRGGGLYNDWGARLTNTTISLNRAHEGGGIFSHGGLNLYDCRVIANFAVQGGGVSNGTDVQRAQVSLSENYGSVRAERTEFSRNFATQAGGGIYNRGRLDLLTSRLVANRADQGGGIFSTNIGRYTNGYNFVTLGETTISANYAREGAGIYNAISVFELHDTTITRNVATGNGGGLLNDSTLRTWNTTISANSAAAGGGLYNGFGSAELVNSTLTGNRARQGGGVFNSLGYVSLDGTTVTGNFGQRPSGNIGGPTPIAGATAPPQVPAAADEPYYTTLPPDLTEYRLDSRDRLLRRPAGGGWTVLAEDVRSFVKIPNGDVYWITNQGVMKQFKLGMYEYTFQLTAQGLVMDDYGTVKNFNGTGLDPLYWAPDRYYVLPPLVPGGPTVALDHPSDYEVAVAAGISAGSVKVAYNGEVQYFAPGPDFPLSRELAAMLDAPPDQFESPANLPRRSSEARSAFTNVRIIKEKTVDTIEPPRYFPGIGLAQLHRAQYKCTIYYTTILPDGTITNEDGQSVVHIDHDHLHRYLAGTPQAQVAQQQLSAENAPPLPLLAAAGEVAGVQAAPASAVTSPGSPVQRPEDNFIRTLFTAPNGTIYEWGNNFDGWHRVGSENGPAVLWRQPPLGIWESIDYVYGFAVGADSSLTILDQHRVLRRQLVGATEWTVIGTGVQSLSQAPDGTLYALTAAGDLWRQAPGSTTWTTLAGQVRAASVTPAGQLYLLTTGGHLQRLLGHNYFVTLDRGVNAFSMDASGRVYAVNLQGELKRWEGLFSSRTLARDVQTYEMALDGRLFALTRQGALQQLTPRDHWTVLERSVRQFLVCPNGDLYLAQRDGTLRRQKVGSSWMTLQGDVDTLSLYSDGSVHGHDSHGELTIYSSLGPYFILKPIATSELSARDLLTAVPPALPPLRFTSTVLPIPDLVAVQEARFVKDKVLDQVERARQYPQVGLATLHRAQYRVLVDYVTVAGVRKKLTLMVDHDHFHFAALGDPYSGNPPGPVALDPPSDAEIARAINITSENVLFPEGPEFPLSREAAAQ